MLLGLFLLPLVKTDWWVSDEDFSPCRKFTSSWLWSSLLSQLRSYLASVCKSYALMQKYCNVHFMKKNKKDMSHVFLSDLLYQHSSLLGVPPLKRRQMTTLEVCRAAGWLGLAQLSYVTVQVYCSDPPLVSSVSLFEGGDSDSAGALPHRTGVRRSGCTPILVWQPLPLTIPSASFFLRHWGGNVWWWEGGKITATTEPWRTPGISLSESVAILSCGTAQMLMDLQLWWYLCLDYVRWIKNSSAPNALTF